MGQQQLLIIVLTVLIVGMAVYGAFNWMNSYGESAQRDLIIQRMNILVGEAKKYAAKPASLGGGDGSFVGFSPPAKLAITPELRIYATSGDTWILFQGFGTTNGEDGRTPVEVVGQFDKTQDDWSTLVTVN
ncbi:MAG TPA: hypothetical protein VI758_05375 [Bacteroidota bacterium]